MIKKLLVPTDFSEQAENALRVAAQMARRFNSEIYLLHLLELPEVLIDGVSSTRSSDLPEALYFMRLAHKKFKELMAKPFLQGITVHETAEFHGAFDGIMNYVEKYKINLIVMGSHGRSGLEDFFIGSNTEKVVRNSHVPVLVIKKRHENFEVNNFVFATDLQDDNLKALDYAFRLSETVGTTLHLVFVNTPNQFTSSADIKKMHESFFKKLNRPLYKLTVYNDTSVERGILNYAESIGADMIGVGAHGRKGLVHFFNGSLSEDIVNHAKRPVVTFKI